MKLKIILIIILLIVVLSFPFYLEISTDGYPVVTFENDEINVHEWGTFIWEWEDFANVPVDKGLFRRSDGVIGGYSIGNSVTVRTENPKVRKISYSIIFYIDSLELFYSDKTRRFKHAKDALAFIKKTVGSYLYDFNNEQLRKLEQFYNPLRDEQQVAFKQLLETWVNQHLEDTGIKIIANDFSIS